MFFTTTVKIQKTVQFTPSFQRDLRRFQLMLHDGHIIAAKYIVYIARS